MAFSRICQTFEFRTLENPIVSNEIVFLSFLFFFLNPYSQMDEYLLLNQMHLLHTVNIYDSNMIQHEHTWVPLYCPIYIFTQII